MIDEMAILNQLKSYIVSKYDQYKITGDTTSLRSADVIVDSPDMDNMTSNLNIWLEPNTVDIDDWTTYEDQASFNVKLCIIAKRGKSAELQQQVFNVKTAIYKLLRDNQSLGGVVDLISITSYSYFPQLFDELGIVGMDVDLNIIYTLDLSD